MSELTLQLVRIGFLAILWIFVLSAISVVRTDMFGARVGSANRSAERRRGAGPAPKARAPRRGLPTQLAVINGPTAGETVPLSEAPIVIGRGADARIVLDDDYVSTRHARVAVSGDQWFVEDLGSTNGTYIGTVRIHQPTAVSVGTRIRIGKTELELRK
jgi:hypothetical protein